MRLRCGKISITDDARTVLKFNTVFVAHKLDNFWTNAIELRCKISILKICLVLFCTTILTHISSALIFGISSKIPTSKLLSSDRLIEPSCSLGDDPALKKQKCNSDVED